MPHGESPEDVRYNEVERTYTNANALERLTDKANLSEISRNTLLVVAAELESEELEGFVRVYQELAAQDLSHIYSPETLSSAALGIIRRVRRNSPHKNEQLPAISDVQADVKAKLDDQK